MSPALAHAAAEAEALAEAKRYLQRGAVSVTGEAVEAGIRYAMCAQGDGEERRGEESRDEWKGEAS